MVVMTTGQNISYLVTLVAVAGSSEADLPLPFKVLFTLNLRLGTEGKYSQTWLTNVGSFNKIWSNAQST